VITKGQRNLDEDGDEITIVEEESAQTTWYVLQCLVVLQVPSARGLVISSSCWSALRPFVPIHKSQFMFLFNTNLQLALQ